MATTVVDPLAMAAPCVTTSLGRVCGVPTPRSHHAADAFLGIPYALPPVNDLRFAPPQDYNAPLPKTTFDANAPPCHQTTGEWDTDPRERPVPPTDPPPSEDCLYLNIWRPATPRNASALPVLWWIHGGGFVGGANSIGWYNGSKLAAQHNAIVVSIQYRLGPLGFLALPELAQAHSGATGGLNGLRDAISSLRWVRRHIAAFGGDPSRVTAWGESSGGVAVCVLNASPEAAGLFSSAVVMSGPCIVEGEGWGPESQGMGLARGKALMHRLGARSLAELRRLQPQRIQWDNATLNDDNFCGYSFDNHVLRRPPRVSYVQGDTVARRLLIGHTSKDGTAQFYGSALLANASAAQWASAMNRRWGARSRAVMERYPLARFGNLASAAYIEADSDERVACPTREMAKLAAAHGAVWHYVYAHLSLVCDVGYITLALPWWMPRERLLQNLSGWASHGAGLHFVFQTLHGPDDLEDYKRQECVFGDGEWALSKAMGTYWASFAASGRPSGTVAWPTFSQPMGGSVTLSLGAYAREATITELRDYKAGDCAFWASLKREAAAQ